MLQVDWPVGEPAQFNSAPQQCVPPPTNANPCPSPPEQAASRAATCSAAGPPGQQRSGVVPLDSFEFKPSWWACTGGLQVEGAALPLGRAWLFLWWRTPAHGSVVPAPCSAGAGCAAASRPCPPGVGLSGGLTAHAHPASTHAPWPLIQIPVDNCMPACTGRLSTLHVMPLRRWHQSGRQARGCGGQQGRVKRGYRGGAANVAGRGVSGLVYTRQGGAHEGYQIMCASEGITSAAQAAACRDAGGPGQGGRAAAAGSRVALAGGGRVLLEHGCQLGLHGLEAGARLVGGGQAQLLAQSQAVLDCGRG